MSRLRLVLIVAALMLGSFALGEQRQTVQPIELEQPLVIPCFGIGGGGSSRLTPY